MYMDNYYIGKDMGARAHNVDVLICNVDNVIIMSKITRYLKK